jgi:hypothetical protein
MTLIATQGKVVSDVLAHEYDPSSSYCREMVSVTVVAGMKIGSVVTATGVLVVVATTAQASFVVIDESVKDLAPGAASLLCLARGPVKLKDSGLQYGADITTAPQKAAIAVVLAAKGLLVDPTI